jgi:hypothetical protein
LARTAGATGLFKTSITSLAAYLLTVQQRSGSPFLKMEINLNPSLWFRVSSSSI